MNSLFLVIIAVISFQGISSITDVERQAFLDQHNNLRQQVAQGKLAKQPAAANMIKLKWDASLEAKAQNWANQCLIQHDTAAQRKVTPYWWVGQNLFAGPNFTTAVQGWFSENPNYDYVTAACTGSSMCGHYTQVIWARTEFIGCAYAKCKGSTSSYYIVICNYGVGGNSGGAPYVKGTACSQCPTGYKCSNSLCVNSTVTSSSNPSTSNKETSISSITDFERQVFLDQHNILRQQVAQGKVAKQPPAANMIKLSWDTTLEAKAQNWANQCLVQHDTAAQRKVPQYWWVGQNLYAGPNFTTAVQAWFGEYPNYDYDKAACTGSSMCGHYTQVIWAGTAFIGCAYANCKGKTSFNYIVICNYGVGGNSGGAAYVKGDACSQCPTGYKCSHSLCVNSTVTSSSNPSTSNKETNNTNDDSDQE